MKIALIGKFAHLHDEEYIARSFEQLGHEVLRVNDRNLPEVLRKNILNFGPDLIMMTKFSVPLSDHFFEFTQSQGFRTVSWNFDLYHGYPRTMGIDKTPGFKADVVCTTDGGHDEEWKKLGIIHHCIRQGIYKDECFLEEGTPSGVIFVGSYNPLNTERNEQIRFVYKHYPEFMWYGKDNTNHIRGTKLNTLYGNTKVVIGDSVYSPHYWSNRVVETLGRGGFLIHQEVEGLKEEYPDLVTYKRGDFDDLKEKIDYYLEHENERREIIEKNFNLVKRKYTMDLKCNELLCAIQ